MKHRRQCGLKLQQADVKRVKRTCLKKLNVCLAAQIYLDMTRLRVISLLVASRVRVPIKFMKFHVVATEGVDEYLFTSIKYQGPVRQG
jgi:hypothetical protein